MTKMKRTKQSARIGKIVLWMLVAALALTGFFVALRNVNAEVSEQGRAKLEDAILRAAVACYAAEGAYPPDVAYLVEHYGLSVDESRYIVHYEIFAENLMPDITVMDKGQ